MPEVIFSEFGEPLSFGIPAGFAILFQAEGVGRFLFRISVRKEFDLGYLGPYGFEEFPQIGNRPFDGFVTMPEAHCLELDVSYPVRQLRLFRTEEI